MSDPYPGRHTPSVPPQTPPQTPPSGSELAPGQQWPQTPPPEQKSQGSAVPDWPGVNRAQAQQEYLPPSPVRFENSIPNLMYTGFWLAIGFAAMPIMVMVIIISITLGLSVAVG